MIFVGKASVRQVKAADNIVVWVPDQVHCLGNERLVISIMGFKECTIAVLLNVMTPSALV